MSKSLPGGSAAFKELLSRCTGNFVPTSLDDFVGDHANERGSGAKAIARKIEQIVRHAKANDNDPLKVLLNGKPGLGKTALSLYFQRLLGCDKWSTTKLNGTSVNKEVVEELARQLHYKERGAGTARQPLRRRPRHHPADCAGRGRQRPLRPPRCQRCPPELKWLKNTNRIAIAIGATKPDTKILSASPERVWPLLPWWPSRARGV